MSHLTTHPVDQRPAYPRLVMLGIQHVLAMYAGAVAVPLIVGGALAQAGKFDAGEIHHLIVADLFVAGIASIIQSMGIWRFGAKLPLMQGVSFVSVAPMISIGTEYGITAIYGSVIATGITMMVISPFFARIAKYFPPLVTGTIITCIGLSLTSVCAGWILDSTAAEDAQGAPINFFYAFIPLLIIVLVQRYAPVQWKPMAVLAGIVVGTLATQIGGYTDWSSVGDAEWVNVPTPFQFGIPTFEITAIVTMLVVGLVIMTETAGDLIAVGEIVGRKVTRQRLADGLRADGFSTFLGGIFNTFPYAAFAQNVGLVSLSKVRSRFVVTTAGVVLLLLGLLPKLGAVVANVPQPVLGGAGVALFGMVTASGIRTLSTIVWTDIRCLIVAISITVAVLPAVEPQLYAHLPTSIGLIAHSGIAMGAIVVIALNLLLNRENNGHITDVATDHTETEAQPDHSPAPGN